MLEVFKPKRGIIQRYKKYMKRNTKSIFILVKYGDDDIRLTLVN